MAKHAVTTTDDEIDAALQTSRLHESEARAQIVEYVPSRNLLMKGQTNGPRLILPIEDVQGLDEATPLQLGTCELLGRGTGISFPELGVDPYVPACRH